MSWSYMYILSCPKTIRLRTASAADGVGVGEHNAIIIIIITPTCIYYMLLSSPNVTAKHNGHIADGAGMKPSSSSSSSYHHHTYVCIYATVKLIRHGYQYRNCCRWCRDEAIIISSSIVIIVTIITPTCIYMLPLNPDVTTTPTGSGADGAEMKPSSSSPSHLRV